MQRGERGRSRSIQRSWTSWETEAEFPDVAHYFREARTGRRIQKLQTCVRCKAKWRSSWPNDYCCLGCRRGEGHSAECAKRRVVSPEPAREGRNRSRSPRRARSRSRRGDHGKTRTLSRECQRQTCVRCGVVWESEIQNSYCCGHCRRDKGHSANCRERRVNPPVRLEAASSSDRPVERGVATLPNEERE